MSKVRTIVENYSAWNIVIDEKLFTKITSASSNQERNEFQTHLKRTVFSEELFDSNVEGQIVESDENDVALLQFSSGSTGLPKGVVLTSSNILTNIIDIGTRIEVSENDRSLSWMPLTHDMGLIAGHLAPLYFNVEHHIMPTTLFTRNPIRWLEIASEKSISILSAPNFGVKHFLSIYKRKKDVHLNLQSVRLILNGAEPISAKACHEFMTILGKYNLRRTAMYPVYGLAEATVAVSFPDISDEITVQTFEADTLRLGEKARIGSGMSNGKRCVDLVSVGNPLDSVEVKIAHNGTICSDSKVGKIFIKGKNVTSGYFQSSKNVGLFAEGWLDTGDCGFVLDGHLYITGREKDIYIYNGQNYMLQDIDDYCESVLNIGPGKVFTCVVNDGVNENETIVVFINADDRSTEQHKRKINVELSKYIGVKPKAVVNVSRFPRTTSGKIQRYKLRNLYMESLGHNEKKQSGHV